VNTLHKEEHIYIYIYIYICLLFNGVLFWARPTVYSQALFLVFGLLVSDPLLFVWSKEKAKKKRLKTKALVIRLHWGSNPESLVS
jgi:hypothetical protein